MTTNKVCGKGKCKFTDEFCASGDCPYDTENVANNVAQRNLQDYVKKSHNTEENEQKTHKNLTEQWKRGELPKGYYYAEDDGEELIIHIQGQNGSVIGDDFDLKATDWIKPIAPVPSYEEYDVMKYRSSRFSVRHFETENKSLKEKLEPFTDPYFRGLTTKDIAELAKKSIRLTTQHCEDNERIEKLEELLKRCRDFINYEVPDHCIDDVLIDKIDEALK